MEKWIAVTALFLFQVFAGKAGKAVADLFSYKKVDPYNLFAGVSVHHIVLMLIALAVIAVLSRLLKVDFGFKVGDKKTGMKYFLGFTAAFFIVAIGCHILMSVYNQLPVYDFPLDKRNVIGTLGFQLFLTGPSEEILFRALPITVLIYFFGQSITLNRSITLEIVIASVLFSFAHINWSLFPLTVEANYFQLGYAFVLGTIQGVAYQKSRSILYPMLMHSSSNVLMVGTGYLFYAYPH